MDIEALNEYLSKLNPEQYNAATYGSGGVLVLAAAGSGKTSTLTSRIAYLIGSENIKAHNILAVTFTNKAAKEMNQRLYKMGVDTKSLWIGTFHGICNKILRYHSEEAGLKRNFYIMDQQEQLSFLKRALRANKYDPKNINVDELQGKINGYKEVGWRANQLRTGSQERNFYEIYEEACIKDNCVDFGELMLGCYELFNKNPHIEESYAEKFEYILVDEFQDTSELQYKWLKKLANKHGNVFAVGDDDQCVIEGTKISLYNGNEKNVEDIKINEDVLSLTQHGSHKGTVTDIFTSEKKGLFVEINSKNNKLIMTGEHIVFVKKNIKNANKYDFEIILGGGKLNQIHQLTNINTNELIFSNDLSDFKSIINNKTEKIIHKAKLGTEIVDCIQAKEIEIGDFVYNKNGELIEVLFVNKFNDTKKVYDLNVKKYHNFCSNGIMVHNSIYSFRGAKPENLNIFKNDFNANLVKIEKNYRSDAYILEAANAVIANNTNRQGKNLVPTKSAKQLVSIYAAFNDEQEAMFIATEMKKLRRALIPYKQMAILYRTNGQSRSLEKALNALNIPYIVYGGFRFFDRLEVKHAMAYLRLSQNPNDNMAFLRVANTPTRAIGETALKKLDMLANEKKCSLYEMAKQLDVKTFKKYEPFITVIDNIKSYCKNKSLPEMVKIILEYSGLEKMYEDDKKDGEERLDNLYELISAAEVFVSENSKANIDEFLAFSILDSDVTTKKRDENIDAVKLMTIHASKGLEFECVFIAGLEESLFPHANSLGDPVAIEEERRLMYVAITRAKAALYISYCEERLLHGQRNRFFKSRFLKEIPVKLIQKLN